MKRYLKVTALIICFMLVLHIPVSANTVADMQAKGIVETKNDPLKLRKGPDTTYDIITYLQKGSIVDVIGKTENSKGESWYKIRANGFEGFSHSQYIRVVEIPEGTDQEFQLVLNNFPQSYHEKLKVLHAIHPSWCFTPLKTNISWETLMREECKTGKNLLQSPDAWKSFEDGAYDWENKKWYTFDSGGWQQACDEVIGYYIDPRNFFDDNIYQFLVLSNDGTHVPVEAIEGLLAGTFMHNAWCDTGEPVVAASPEPTAEPTPQVSGTPEAVQAASSEAANMTYAQALIKAGEEGGVSPYLLAARICQEQGSTGNKLAHGTVTGYEGYYNFFNIGAYAHSGRGAILNGAIYAKSKGWDTPYKAMMGGARFLANGYINKGQNTLYLQKFDVVDGGNGLYSHQYMTNVEAAKSECASLRKAIQGTSAESSELNFLIPVYENMPDTPYTLPLRTGNANNLLDSITVGDARFPQDFNKYVNVYEVFTARTQVEVMAVPSDAGAAVQGTGIVRLHEGVNEHVITVTAGNGLVRKYTLLISTTANEEFNFVCDYPTTDTRITDVSANTKVSDFKAKISAKGYSIGFFDKNGKALEDTELIKTGDYVSVTGEIERKLYVVIKGDSTGDGKLSSRDLLKTQKAILGISNFESGVFKEAADFTGDGKVNSRDLLACQKKILGIN